ncbi:MAG: DUF4926 domain-containing protein [Acidobacteriota bacterium]|jgi:hypothetical protein
MTKRKNETAFQNGSGFFFSCYNSGEGVNIMSAGIKLLDVVALIEALRERKLRRGQVGTVVQELAPEVFEIEFTDNDGRAFAGLALQASQLLVLHYEPAETA